MKRIALFAAALLLSFSAAGLPPEPAPAQARAIALVGATLHVGDGTVLTDATLTFDNGLITAVGPRDEVTTTDHDVIDVSGGTRPIDSTIAVSPPITLSVSAS